VTKTADGCTTIIKELLHFLLTERVNIPTLNLYQRIFDYQQMENCMLTNHQLDCNPALQQLKYYQLSGRPARTKYQYFHTSLSLH
jgi:hypothetical protein